MVELNLSELTMQEQTIGTMGIHTFFLTNFSYLLHFVLYETELRFTQANHENLDLLLPNTKRHLNR